MRRSNWEEEAHKYQVVHVCVVSAADMRNALLFLHVYMHTFLPLIHYIVFLSGIQMYVHMYMYMYTVHMFIMYMYSIVLTGVPRTTLRLVILH